MQLIKLRVDLHAVKTTELNAEVYFPPYKVFMIPLIKFKAHLHFQRQKQEDCATLRFDALTSVTSQLSNIF